MKATVTDVHPGIPENRKLSDVLNPGLQTHHFSGSEQSDPNPAMSSVDDGYYAIESASPKLTGNWRNMSGKSSWTTTGSCLSPDGSCQKMEVA